MTDPTARSEPAAPIPGDAEVLDNVRAILRRYHDDPESYHGERAIRRDRHVLDQIDTAVMPFAEPRTDERFPFALNIPDRRTAFCEWLDELGLAEADALAYGLRNFSTTGPDEVETAVSIIACLRAEYFDTVAELAGRYRFLRSASSEVGKRVRMGLIDRTILEISHGSSDASRELDRALTPGRSGMSRFEQRSIISWARSALDDLSDRPASMLVAALTQPLSEDGLDGGALSGAELAEQVDELRVWRRLLSDEREWPYAVRYNAGSGMGGSTVRGSEAEARQWLGEVTEDLGRGAVIDASIYRQDPASGSQRHCLRVHDMPVAEFRYYLSLLREGGSLPRPEGVYDRDRQHAEAMVEDYIRITRQLNDPRRADIAFESLIHRENLAHHIREFADAAELPSAAWALDAADVNQRPVHDSQSSASVLAQRMDRLAADLAGLRATEYLYITAQQDTGRTDLTVGTWSDSDLGPWFALQRSAGLTESARHFASAEQLLEQLSLAPDAAREVRALAARLDHAQALIHATSATLDTVRRGTLIGAGTFTPPAPPPALATDAAATSAPHSPTAGQTSSPSPQRVTLTQRRTPPRGLPGPTGTQRHRRL